MEFKYNHKAAHEMCSCGHKKQFHFMPANDVGYGNVNTLPCANCKCKDFDRVRDAQVCKCSSEIIDKVELAIQFANDSDCVDDSMELVDVIQGIVDKYNADKESSSS